MTRDQLLMARKIKALGGMAKAFEVSAGAYDAFILRSLERMGVVRLVGDLYVLEVQA